MTSHLPATPEEIAARGWQTIDVLLVTGDAHVDHPAFPAALIGRVLEAEGWRVAVLSRPDPENIDAVRRFGPPRLFAGVTAGALDSMVANYTALKKPRRDDPHAPDGKAGGRPDRALTVYCNLLRRAFGKGVFIVAGGLEASLRRFAHYDYWSNRVRRPILMDCGADVAIYGMGEGPVCEVARALNQAGAHGVPDDRRSWVAAVRNLPGVIWRQPASAPRPVNTLELPDAERVANDTDSYLKAHRMQRKSAGDRPLSQQAGGMRIIVNPPPPQPTPQQLDDYYQLPFTRDPHPSLKGRRVPALEQVRFSVTSHRGCAGGCAFCALTSHQGKAIASRTRQAILDEVEAITRHPRFGGTINDIGGPTANMWGARCTKPGGCARPSCLWPERCAHFVDEQEAYTQLLEQAAKTPGVKHLFVTTGIRTDLALTSPAFARAMICDPTCGHLKVAPEHVVPSVLNTMRKPAGDDFSRFVKRQRTLSRKAGKRQFVVPYLMAAHPGCTLSDMIDLALFLKRENIRAEQCQIFTPTPGTDATFMYAAGLHPDSGEPIFVERNEANKRLQKALILWHKPEARNDIRKALKKANRMDAARELL